MSRLAKGALAWIWVILAAAACETQGNLLLLHTQTDTLQLRGSVDSTVVTTADTTIGSPDTVIVIVTDTVVVGGDTTVTITTDTIVTVDTVVVVDTVSVTPIILPSVASLTLEVGQTATLSASGQDALGFPTGLGPIAWVSDAPSVASVTPSAGVVSGNAVGSANIFALANGLSTSVPTTVVAASTPPPPPPTGPRGVAFHSDWGTDIGMSPAALRDLSKDRPWTFHWGGDLNTVVVDEGFSLGFPTPNVLANTVTPSRNGGQVQIMEDDGYYPPPAIGESLYIRFYRRISLPDSHSADQTTHGFHDDILCCSTGNFAVTFIANTSGTFAVELNTGFATNDSLAYWTTESNALRKHETYRFEFQILRTGQETFQLHARVYDRNEVLVLGDDDFDTRGWGARRRWTLADNRELRFNSRRGVRGLLDMRVGLNSLNGVRSAFTHGYWGAFAICTQTWCGPYQDGK